MIPLDAEQTKAVYAPSGRPTIVNASAGSGKTRCLIAKILLLLEQGVDPKNICAITFTNKAANEMKKRLETLCSSIKNMQVSTIHSLCVQIINLFIHHTYLNPPFSIYDENHQLSVIRTIVKSREFPGEPKIYTSAISNIKSSGKGDLESPKGLQKAFRKSRFVKDLDEQHFIFMYKAYLEILFKNNACDFDDLLTYAHDCLKHEDCSDYYSKLWPHLLVDEFQDTSLIQYNIINKLHTKNSKTLFVVADFNQAIYSWRGANPENINDFIDKHDPSICNLIYNYRSSPEIIKHANQFLQYGEPMVAKNNIKGKVSFTKFSSQEEEAEKIAMTVMRNGDYENTAILFRVNTRSLFFERAFAKHHIPYKVVGALPYYRRRVSRDLLSYLKASANRSDLESLTRIVNTPPRGFGPKKKERLLREGWPYLEEMALGMPLIQGLINLLNKIRGMHPSDAINLILFKTDYRLSIKKDSDRQMLASFTDVISGFETIEELILASNFIEEDTGHGVKLLTAHASKGLEFNLVLIVGVEEGIWPHSFAEDIDEEKRLFYVACTRAMKHLNISYSMTRVYQKMVKDSKPSVLLLESLNNYKEKGV